MPWLARGRDPYWDVEGATARNSRRRRRILAVAVVALSVLLLVLLLARIVSVDAQAILVGPGRPLIFGALVADALACCLVFVREMRHPIPT